MTRKMILQRKRKIRKQTRLWWRKWRNWLRYLLLFLLLGYLWITKMDILNLDVTPGFHVLYYSEIKASFTPSRLLLLDERTDQYSISIMIKNSNLHICYETKTNFIQLYYFSGSKSIPGPGWQSVVRTFLPAANQRWTTWLLWDHQEASGYL